MAVASGCSIPVLVGGQQKEADSTKSSLFLIHHPSSTTHDHKDNHLEELGPVPVPARDRGVSVDAGTPPSLIQAMISTNTTSDCV